MYIIFDSNLLHGRIKIESQELKAICSNAKKIGWQVYLPEPVIIELKQGAREKFMELSSHLDGVQKDFSRHQIDLEVKVLNESSFLDNYAKRLLEFIKTNAIQICPFPKEFPKPEELFILASQKKCPFDKSGNNFRDVVIWYSSAELAKRHSDKKIYLVTRDGKFREAADSFTSKNIQCVTYEEAYKATQQALDGAIRERYERFGNELERFIEEADFISKTENRVKEEIDFSLGEGPSEKLISIDSFSITHRIGIDSFSEERGSATCRISYIGLVNFKVEVPAYYRDIWKGALNAIIEKPSKVGQARKKEPVKLPSNTSAALTLSELFGDDYSSTYNFPLNLGNIAESRKKYFVVDATVQLSLNEDAVAGSELVSVTLSDENPFQYIDFEGNTLS